MENKKCNKCQEIKTLSEFNKGKNKKDGYQSYCRECNKIKLKTHYQNNKDYYSDKKKVRVDDVRNLIKDIKAKSKCARCPEDDAACLDFHHEGNKDFNIGEAIVNGYSIGRVKEKIDKCIILCSNCHRKLHYYES